MWLIIGKSSLELREKIIEAATGLFRQFGVRSVTMDDIARQAGMSKKTIYQEFKNKGELVFEAFSAFLEKDECKLQEIFDREDGVIEHFVQMSKFIRERYSDMNPIILNEIKRFYPQSWKRFEEFKREHATKGMVEILERGKRLGYFRKEINVEIMAMMRMEQVAFNYQSLPSASKFNMMELQLQIFDHFIHGVLTDKGRTAYYNEPTNQN
ncbi:MAG: TetR/AcrR family transcriptional regulator [Anditalea sp.]